jgi:hypothetical protein
MFTSNPFAELSASLSPSVMQTYIVVMIILVAVGTIYDVLHKKSAKYFSENMRKAKASSTTKVGGGEAISMAIKTAVVDVAASVWLPGVRHHHSHYGVSVPYTRHPDACHPAAIVVAGRADGLPRWLLVLVLHSR